MRKFLLSLAALVAVGVASSAQNVKIGVNVGTDLGWYSSSKARFNSSDMKAGAFIGGTVGYEFGNGVVVNSGLNVLYANANFSANSIYYTTNNAAKYESIDVKTWALEVPVTIGYNFKLGDKLTLQPNVGFYARYGLASSSGDIVNNVAVMNSDGTTTFNKVTDSWKAYDGYHRSSDGQEDKIDAFRRWDVGVTAGVKLGFLNHYSLSFNYTHGLTKLHESMGINNNTVRIGIGYTF